MSSGGEERYQRRGSEEQSLGSCAAAGAGSSRAHRVAHEVRQHLPHAPGVERALVREARRHEEVHAQTPEALGVPRLHEHGPVALPDERGRVDPRRRQLRPRRGGEEAVGGALLAINASDDPPTNTKAARNPACSLSLSFAPRSGPPAP